MERGIEMGAVPPAAERALLTACGRLMFVAGGALKAPHGRRRSSPVRRFLKVDE